MLSHYQTMELLRDVRKIVEKTNNPDLIEAVERAIIVVNKYDDYEPCVYDGEHECQILLEKNCASCKFRKTKRQLKESEMKIKRRLKKVTGVTTTK